MIPKVAHILPFPAVGGTEVATLRVADAARENGFDSIIYCPEGAASVRELFLDRSYPVSEYRRVSPSYRSPLDFIGNSRRLARSFRDRGISLVHCADILAAYFAGYAARLAGLPLLCHVRNRYDRISLRDRSFLLPVQKFAFVSQDTWRHFAKRVSASRGTVLYDGIDLPELTDREADRAGVRREFGIPHGAPVVGMVARVAPQKDFPTLVEAAARVSAALPEVRFLIVGDCSGTEANRAHLAATRSLITARGLERNFIFTDYRRDVPRFLNAMDVFVLATNWEGLPLVLLEAMARALPVVATEVDGIPELVVEGRTGFLHPHGDAQRLADRLQELLSAPAEATELGRAARSHVATCFSREAFGAAVAGLYSGMLKGRRVRGRPTAAAPATA